MSVGGEIRLDLHEQPGQEGTGKTLLMTVEDSGPGIQDELLDRVFEAGFSAQSKAPGCAGWPTPHRGLGLSISRSIIEKAGGRIFATNRAPVKPPHAGACIAIELPVRTR
jgi:signal transduction histidine kinase